jgi:sucrose-6-phosphate hydrolase SacC (GH32 family)
MERSTDVQGAADAATEVSTTPTIAPPVATDAPATTAPQPTPARYTELYRPQYHFSARSGWLGDPDGMIRYKGIYHVFWWGHAESPDLVHWNQRPDPLVGDDGSFVYYSGSVVVDEQNTSGFGDGNQPPMVAIYTMHDKASGREVQGLSTSLDYTSFHFYDRNPVLEAEHDAFRDPQVFRYEPTGQWIMAITMPEARQVRFYASQDLKRWDYLSEFGPLGAQSQLWEVPDLFPLPVDGDPANIKWVLLCGMGPNRVQYFVGDFDGRSFTLDSAANSYLLAGTGVPGTVFADFEQGLPAGWQIAGAPSAVGADSDPGRERPTGHIGAEVLSTAAISGRPGDGGTVTITSPPFVIGHTAINFLIAGGGDPAAQVNLIIRGAVVRSAFGNNTPYMHWINWNVSEFKGAEAQLEIVDKPTAADVLPLAVDHIVFGDVPMETGREHANWLDFGPDYYAVRIYRDYDAVEDRTVTLGWMGNWEYANTVPTSWGKGALALPRELELRSYPGGLRLMQRPIPAFEQLRQDAVQLGQLELSGRRSLQEFVPARNTYEIDVTFAIADPDARFGLSLAKGGEHDVTVGYDAHTSTVFLDRTHPENAGFSGKFRKYATAPLEPRDGTVRLQIFVDQSSVEVFANDGERTLTALMFPDPDSTGIELFSENGSTIVNNLRAWELRSIWEAQ